MLLCSGYIFFSPQHYLWLHLSKRLWRFICIVALHFLCQTRFSFLFFVYPCDSLPPALHFVVLSSHKVPLDTSGTKLCNVSHQEDLCNQAEELVLTQFLLIYYLSSQALAQTFITPSKEKDLGMTLTKGFFFLEVKVLAKKNHALIASSQKYNLWGNS